MLTVKPENGIIEGIREPPPLLNRQPLASTSIAFQSGVPKSDRFSLDVRLCGMRQFFSLEARVGRCSTWISEKMAGCFGRYCFRGLLMWGDPRSG